MKPLAAIATGLVALRHIYFLVLEMFLWDHPFGRRTFRLTPEFAAATVHRKILLVQAFPGTIALALVWLAHR